MKGILWTGTATAAVAGASLLLACAVNPATGERQLALYSQQQEIAMGQENDRQVASSLGLYEDQELAAYVEGVGKRLAAVSERPDLPWSFKVVDDPVVNAFALPGGYIYVTRGILAHLSSEAELAGVLGHEIGHVTARHTVTRLSKAQLATLGLSVGMVASERFRRWGDLAQAGLGVLFLKYSRDDERQADDLGFRYAVRAGYDARALPGVYTVLQRVGELSGGSGTPAWLATHPDPGARRERMQGLVSASSVDFTGARLEGAAYLGRMDGIVFGADPREGYFEGDVFYHPGLAFSLRFPAGWTKRNQRQAVVAAGPDEDVLVELGLAAEETPLTASRAFAAEEGIEAGQPQTGRVHGLPAVLQEFTVPSESQPLHGRVAFVRHRDRTFRILGVTLESTWSSYEGALRQTILSFEQVTDQRVLSVQPARLEVRRLSSATPLRALETGGAAAVGVEELAVLNHVDVGATLAAGSLAKRVVGGPAGAPGGG